MRCIFCVHALWFFYLCRMTSMRPLHTAAWKPTFKSVFIGLQVVSKLSYATQRTQHNGHMACDAIKNQNTRRMHAKNNPRIDSILCMHCIFRHFSCAYISCVAFVALHSLRCIWQLGNRLLSLFSAFWWRRLCFDVRHVYVNLRYS